MMGDLHSRGESNYERPGLPWVCGHAAEGDPCPLGPSRLGVCGATSDCDPQLIDDRWVCNRPPHRGGPCASGPSPEGTCSRCFTECAPVRSLASRRGWFTLCCTALTIGILAIVLSFRGRDEVLVPGKLTAGHRLILDGHQDHRRCQHCHAAAEEDVLAWLVTTCSGGQCVGTPQSMLCMKCHEQTIDVRHALHAHTLSPDMLAAIRTSHGQNASEGNRRSQRQMACATCHREHHGSRHELTAITDSQCQVCHAQQFHDLAHGHPEFKNWPQPRETVIEFDHRTHAYQHFPKQQAEFACGNCHSANHQGEMSRSVDYRRACASCHDRPLSDRAADGFVFLQLPMIDDLAFQDAGINVGEWPEFCTGDFDGPIPPIMRLLLLADGRARAAFDYWGPGFEFGDIDPDDPEHLQMASDLVWAIKGLLYELGARGQSAAGERLTRVLGRDVAPAEVGRLLAHLPGDLLYDLSADWLPKLPQEIQLREIGQWPPLAERASYTQVPATNGEGGPPVAESGELETQPWPENPLRAARRPGELLRDATLRESPADKRSKTGPQEGSPEASLRPAVSEHLQLGSPKTDVPATGLENEASKLAEAMVELPKSGAGRTILGSPSARVPGGGWYRDDEVFALCYRGTGHADAFYQAWHEASALAMRTKQRLWEPENLPELGGCRNCHRVELETLEQEWVWSSSPTSRLEVLTRFSHQPHLTQPQLKDCQACHVLDAGDNSINSALDPSLAVMHSDFCGITKQACVGCHAGSSERGSCTTCHHYHARDRNSLDILRTTHRASTVR